jgi:hypothetical protein
MRLKETEAIQGELSERFRKAGELLHNGRVRQIALKDLRHLILEVTHYTPYFALIVISKSTTASGVQAGFTT